MFRPVIAMKKKVNIVEDTIDVGEVYTFLQTPRAGGIAVFVGTTRQWTGEQETVRLEYDCYEAMALKEMDQLVAEVGKRWPVLGACILHRVGVVPVAEASVVIGVATAHRADAFAACRYLIDTLKETVPIWKREVYADGTTEWVEGSNPK